MAHVKAQISPNLSPAYPTGYDRYLATFANGVVERRGENTVSRETVGFLFQCLVILFIAFCSEFWVTLKATHTVFLQSEYSFVCFWRDSPQWAMASSFTRFLDHTQRRTTVSRTPLDEWSARRRYLYLTTHSTHKRQISMSPVGFEPTISAS